MQTFLPYSDFISSAKVLDNRHLNKQIVEAYQIYTGRVPQKNHPACLMWKDREAYLSLYIFAMGKEYKERFHRVHKVIQEMFSNEAYYTIMDFASQNTSSWLFTLIRLSISPIASILFVKMESTMEVSYVYVCIASVI